MKKSFVLLSIFAFFFSFYFIIFSIDNKKIIRTKLIYEIGQKNKQISNHLNIIDFSKDICPREKYNSFNCVKLLKIYISPILCLHDLQNDFTSRQIRQNRIKERTTIEFFLDYLVLNPKSLFIDIGSHVGLYSMYAAKLGTDVIAIDAFSENIFRLHRAANLNNVKEKIILLNNAVSYQSDLYVQLNQQKNIGEQSLFEQKLNNKTSENMNMVKTIILDDLINVIPVQHDENSYRKAILKIDIEGYEPYAFLNATKIFEKLDFNLILMEWHQIKRHKQVYLKEIEKMIDFLTKNDLVPYADRKILNTLKWSYWPSDIYWFKKSILNK